MGKIVAWGGGKDRGRGKGWVAGTAMEARRREVDWLLTNGSHT